MLNQGYGEDQRREQLTRELVEASIRHGLAGNGNPSEAVIGFYRDVYRQLGRADVDHGPDAMVSAARFAIAAVEGGIIYPGSETTDFLREVARGVDAANRDTGPAAGPSY